MPTTVNGVGTHYYGRKNERRYIGTCDSCGFQGQMTDYETGYYFVFLFIPLIPLGKKQILGDCPSCRRHRVMPLAEWQQIREEAIEKKLAELGDAPDDPDKALELIGTFTLFNQRADAIDLAASTQRSHSNNPDVQIALGGWYEQQGLAKEANICFERAVELDPDYPPCRRIRAFDLMDEGQPRQAAEQLQPLRHPSEHFDPGVFLLLAQCFERHDQPDKALAEYAELITNVPDLGKDKGVRKAVKKLEKKLGKTETILPKKGLFG